MATVPTGRLERELRKLYMTFVQNLPDDPIDVDEKLKRYIADSTTLISRMGGDISRMGVSAGFPAPKLLDLDLWPARIYKDVEQVVVRAGIATGLNAKDIARAMYRQGVDSARWRLNRLARTEVVGAYWKNQRAEAADLGLVLLWSAEKGKKTCEWCLERDGLVAEDGCRDHPNGRCTLVAVLPSMVDYKGSVRADGTIYHNKDWDKEFLSPHIDNMSLSDKSALDEYQHGKYNEINDSLRRGLIDPNHEETIRILDKLSHRGTTTESHNVLRIQGHESLFKDLDVTLRDGALESQFPGLPKNVVEQMLSVINDSKFHTNPVDWDLDAVIGKTFTSKAYTSTTLGDTVPGSFTGNVEMRIVVPRGTPAIKMTNDFEQELLLGRDLKFRVTGARWDSDKNKFIFDLMVVKR